MAVLIGLLLVIFSMGIVMYPFFKVTRLGNISGSTPLDEPVKRRNLIYSDIRTLELDHQLGKLEEDDYHRRLHIYRINAAATFKEQEDLEQMDNSIEDIVASKRLGRRPEV
jgi:hypothetical protein